ncbi:MAG: 9-O-acetylesterase, partial [Chitinophagaceae bacterium]|nr:9-O-acetylesterase [Chitinophagaceae bacterium]
MKYRYFLLLLVQVITSVFVAQAQLRLPAFFGDHMVLQRQQPIPIWGWAKPGEKITVTLDGKMATTRADKTGKWRVNLPAMEAGGPFTLQVAGQKENRTLQDVLLGEVWLCSGQSNMEWRVALAMNPEQEKAAANYPQIRHYKVDRTVAATPQQDVTGTGWQPALPQYVSDFTAVGYFFARHLHQTLKVPIGLLNTSWGGTHVETWTSREAFEGHPEFADMIKKVPAGTIDSIMQNRAADFNRMMAGLKQSIAANGNTALWSNTDANDTDWKTLTVPGLWEQQGLPGLDGLVWIRRVVNLTQQQAEQMAVLNLGLIDDRDETWVNGQKVGETKLHNLERSYTLPEGTLKAGNNLIAIKIDDTGGGGGLYSAADALQLVLANGQRLPLAGSWKYRVEAIHPSSSAGAVGPNEYATLLYNAMVHPLVSFGIKGAIWYQGESNTGRAHQYRQAFPLMINDWRNRWGQGDFPFYFVQLATYFAGGGGNKNSGNEWAELREAQALTLQLPNTGMVVTTDIGNPKDIHPTNKQEVGRRLAQVALQQTYG